MDSHAVSHPDYCVDIFIKGVIVLFNHLLPHCVTMTVPLNFVVIFAINITKHHNKKSTNRVGI